MKKVIDSCAYNEISLIPSRAPALRILLKSPIIFYVGLYELF